MSKAGCPYDNVPMERFYNTFKSNFYNVSSFPNVEMMDELTMKYINWYNYVRPHSYNRNLLDKRCVKNPVKSILLEVIRSG